MKTRVKQRVFTRTKDTTKHILYIHVKYSSFGPFGFSWGRKAFQVYFGFSFEEEDGVFL
jgi:hypothetical protein